MPCTDLLVCEASESGQQIGEVALGAEGRAALWDSDGSGHAGKGFGATHGTELREEGHFHEIVRGEA